MSDEKNFQQEQTIIDAGQTVERFLGDDVVKAAFDRVEQNAFAKFKAATTVEAREQAWAVNQALEGVRTELRATVDRGTVAQHERKVRSGNRPK